MTVSLWKHGAAAVDGQHVDVDCGHDEVPALSPEQYGDNGRDTPPAVHILLQAHEPPLQKKAEQLAAATIVSTTFGVNEMDPDVDGEVTTTR